MFRWTARLAAVAAMLAAGAAEAGINFIGIEPSASLAHTDRIATGDLDGDGRADVVEAGARDHGLAVHLSRREPAFGTEFLNVGQAPEWPAIGDVDGDGRADVVCADRAAGGIWVLTGELEGRLSPPSLVAVGQRPHALALADIDGRNGPDLIVADAAGQGRIFALLNRGNSLGFAEAVEVQEGRQADELLAVDVNRDGRPDIVSLNLAPPRAKEVVISRFRGLADGMPQFDAQPLSVVVEGNPAHLLAAELTGDSAVDLALVNQPRDARGGEIVVLAGDGAGGFSPSHFPVACPFFTLGKPCPIRGLAALDANSDRRTDLAVALVDPRGNGDAFQILAGGGAGRFVPASVFATPEEPRAIVGAQASDDCRPDVVAAFGQNLSLAPFINTSVPGGTANGATCARGDECLSVRCTDDRCCASSCQEGERCDVSGHEGDCTPPTAMRACVHDADCTTQPGQPICADGFCCDARCEDGRCDAPGFEGVCIPNPVEEPPLLGLAEPCADDEECASGVCDAFVGICCSRRCDPRICDEIGHCTVTEPATARADAVVALAATCRGDCDGDGVVRISEVVRVVANVVGSEGALACGADQTIDRCLSIDDVIGVVNASLVGCAASAADG